MRRAGAIVLALVAALVLVGALALRSDGGYRVRAEFANAGGLRPGFVVRVDGVPVGKVTDVELGRGDRALVEARVDESAAPLGRDARATVRPENLLGEKYLDIDRGDPRTGTRPPASAALIPASRTGVAVELDDVVDALDVPTRAALTVVLNEIGRGLAGRGHDLAALLAALPPGLDRTEDLVRAVGSDSRALGDLIEQSDRVVTAIASEREQLGRLVDGAAGTFDTLAGRRRPLGATVRTAPSTLRALREALAALEGAAIPLGPAADGLRETAPALTATLRELPPVAEAAAPTLRTARRVAPELQRLATRGTPAVRRLRPLAGELRTFSTGVEPATRALDDGIADLLGAIEGWARATAGRDASGHVFRVGATFGSDLLGVLLPGRRDARPPADRERTPRAAKSPSPLRLPDAAPARTAQPRLPDLRQVPVPNLPVPDALPSGDDVEPLLDFLLEP